MGNACLTAGILACTNCCVSQVGAACSMLLQRTRLIKLGYVILDLLVVLPAIFILYAMERWLSFAIYFGRWINCPEDSNDGWLGTSVSCLGISAVYRLSFSLLLVYLMLALVMLCRNRCSQAVNEGLFFVKYLSVILVFLGSLYIGNGLFLQYGEACRYIGLVFLVLQSIILIDLFYLWGIRWAAGYDSNSTGCYSSLLIACTILMYGGAWLCNIYGYARFYECSFWTNVGTSLLLILLPLVQLLNLNPQNSLLTTAAVCIYVSYLGLISQFSKVQCNSLSTSAMVADMVTSTLLFFLTMYGTIMGGTGSPEQQPVAQSEQQQELPAEYVSWEWVKWHLYMAVGSMYIAMMVTNWGSPQMSDQISNAYRPNSFAYGSRVILQFSTSLLYIWTLVAPGVCPQRDFTVV